MKKFKLVYWSDCRGMEIDGVEVVEFEKGRDVLKYLIEEKIEDEDWVEYVNGMFNYEGDELNWVKKEEEWEMFMIGDNGLDDVEFCVDFCNELNSCLILREDSKFFNEEFKGDEGCELVNKIEEGIGC